MLEEQVPKPVMFNRFIEWVSDQKYGQAKESTLHIGKNDGAVSLEITANRVDEWDAHSNGLFRSCPRSVQFRRRQFRVLCLVKSGIHLLDDLLYRLIEVSEERLGIDSNPESQDHKR